MSTISTHVLDSATGRPAAGVQVRLETKARTGPDGGTAWLAVGRGVTDSDGRLKNFADDPAGIGSYRIIFDTQSWFDNHERECFYPEVIITFTVKDDGSHYHVPLLLSAFAYSTYRGS